MSKFWTAASAALAGGGHTDQGAKWYAGVTSARLGKERLSAAGMVPAAGLASGRSRGGGNGCEVAQAEDSFRQAMYISCWGPS
ncbi:hypothetical protein AXF42_Ash011034 [Apostasia shenzhenica]|uniref:Uncharacterized protein n=1 Tax=Apostasia shenzhenica TaxID=1088818 RepID=A0A2H9ZQW8_9ASPA|nr:hypothetical protein AXF42_Ash011034 [Apostasia shenzhenica]